MLHWYDRVWAWILTFWYWLVIGALVAIALWGWLRPTVPAVPSRSLTNVVAVTQSTTPQPTATKTNTPASTQIPITATQSVTVSEGSLVTTTQVNSSTMPITVTTVVTQGKWLVTYYPGATTEMRSWQFRTPDPKLWKLFPNVDNGVYKASDGVEYGMAESIFCQQDQRCDVIVAARHYRLITGDYDTVFGKCAYGDGGAGCALLIVNVGDQTVAWRNQVVDAGFTVTGRYWNGRKLDQAIWAVLSHAAYNMLNLSGEGTNAGSNCSSPNGCRKVKLTFVVTFGKEVLVRGETFVSR